MENGKNRHRLHVSSWAGPNSLALINENQQKCSSILIGDLPLLQKSPSRSAEGAAFRSGEKGRKSVPVNEFNRVMIAAKRFPRIIGYRAFLKKLPSLSRS
jgi:hypothetical protein